MNHCNACGAPCRGPLCDDCDRGSYDGESIDAAFDRIDAEFERMTPDEIHADLVEHYGSEAEVQRVIGGMVAWVRWLSENPEAAKGLAEDPTP